MKKTAIFILISVGFTFALWLIMALQQAKQINVTDYNSQMLQQCVEDGWDYGTCYLQIYGDGTVPPRKDTEFLIPNNTKGL
jgi:hypothetical protein